MVRTLGIATLLATTLLSGVASAAPASVEGTEWDAKERFMIRGRIVGVIPQEDSTIQTIGGEIEAEGDYVPEVDFSYFFTDHIAAELIAATSKHDMGASNTTLGNVDAGDVWVLPPTLTLQYHFNPFGVMKPYVGAGVNYTVFYNADKGALNSISYEDGFGYALQAGMDYEIDEHWNFNVDVKQIWHNVDAKLNGTVNADVDLDPMVVGMGFGYRF